MARPKGPRGLKPEERALWAKIAERTRPLHPRMPADRPADPIPPVTPEPPQPEPREPIAPFRMGEKAGMRDHAAIPGPAAPTVRIDKKAHRKLARGKLEPEARIDLHGMTLDQAHAVLDRFILNSQRAGRRLVLVITGKGRSADDDGPIPARQGVLRQTVPGWLRSGPLSVAVVDVVSAHQRHGGGGAFYVYLRRMR